MAKLYIGNNPAVLGMYDNGVHNQDKTITANGTYTADSGYTGLGTVTVSTPTITKDYSEADWTTVVNIVETDLVSGATSSSLLSAGWVQGGYSSSSSLTRGKGFVLASDCSSIDFRKDQVQFYKIPSSATTEEVDYSGVTAIRINFSSSSTERWYCLAVTNTTFDIYGGSGYQMRTPNSTQSGWSNGSNTFYLRCMIVRGADSSLTSLTDTLGSGYNMLPNTYKKIKLSVSSTSLSLESLSLMNKAYYCQMICGLENWEEFITYFTEYDSTTQRILLDAADTVELIGAGSYAGLYNIIPFIDGTCPFILDCSNATGTGILNTCPQYNDYAFAQANVTNLKIKLPSTYSRIRLRPTVAGTMYRLDMESLEFLAENAPTVSGTVYLNMGRGYYWIATTARGQAVLTTLTNKGWTVTAD